MTLVKRWLLDESPGTGTTPTGPLTSPSTWETTPPMTLHRCAELAWQLAHLLDTAQPGDDAEALSLIRQAETRLHALIERAQTFPTSPPSAPTPPEPP